VIAMSRLMILGAGGHGTVIVEIAQLMNKWDEIVFLDDNVRISNVNGYKVIGGLDDYKKYKEKYQCAFVAIGNNKLRLELTEQLIEEGFTIPTLIHPFSFISDTCQIGKGTVVMAGTVIMPYNNRQCLYCQYIKQYRSRLHIGKRCSYFAWSTYWWHNLYRANTWICIGSSIANNIKIGKM